MQEHDKWIAIAREDLGVARISLTSEYFSSVTYHCQQCAEKSLKGYLSFKGKPVAKTHDLIKLLEECMEFDRDFITIYKATRVLSPFATKFRYPSEFDIPDFDKAQESIQYADAIITFVLKKIFLP